VSFVARQRDLRDLIGDAVPGAERLNFGDAMKHWEDRFHRITLEDRNLPAIAERRVLKVKDDAAKKELDAAFEQTHTIRDAVMNILLTREGDRGMFRKVYPFSPALVQTLIAVSSVLQRERTALKVMMQLLVEHRETLRVGDIVPVGDLFDVIAHGDEAFSPEMALHFDNAKRLYHQKLLPLLERQHGRQEELEALTVDDAKRISFRNDDRLIKTLLLAALVPEVESLKGINGERLAALNHGTIRTPVSGSRRRHPHR
jgi:ribosomal protein L23